MAVVEQERRPVLLRRDRVVGALVDDLEVGHAELVAERRARVGAHRAGHDQRRLLRQVIGEREHLGRHLGLRHHALDGAGAVAHLEEVQLPARAPSREPAAQRDRAARVRADPLDRRHLRHAAPTHSSGGERRQRLVAGRRGRLESAAGGTAMLGFRLNEEQESFRLAVRSFAEKALAPRVEELERTETFPMDLFRELGRLGYLGVGYPEEYGGSGGDMVMRCLLIEEIARVNCGFAAALLAHVGLGCIPIFRFGTEEQKRGYLVPAARSVGVSQAALEAALEYAREREQFGQPIAKFQAIKFKLARMATEVETARTMMWRAAWLFDQGYCMREAAMAKLFASEVAQRVTWEAVQLFGGCGYINEFTDGPILSQARLLTI